MAKAIATVFHPRKMNYELLGNTVAHLHWHLVTRYSWDPNPQRPIWEHTHAPKVLSLQEYAETIDRHAACPVVMVGGTEALW